jgi:hypothetical protein
VNQILLELEIYMQFSLLAGLLQQKLRFDPRLVRVRLFAEKMSLGQISVVHPVYYSIDATHISFSHSLRCTGLFEMIVGVLTTCHTQYT